MATKYKIATEFSILDRASAQLNKMSTAGGLVGRAWSKGIADAQMRLDAFGKSVAAAGKMAVGLGVGAVSAGLAPHVREDNNSTPAYPMTASENSDDDAEK